MNLKLCQLIVTTADNDTGLDWLERYDKQKVFHPGYDINSLSGNQDFNLPVLSPADGIVEFVYKGKWHNGFGIFIIIWHEKLNRWTRYAHLNSTFLKIGDRVNSGWEVGRLGKTGTTISHLHFEVWTPQLHQLQIKYWRGSYRFYPVNWPKWKVMQYYEDPEIFLEKCQKFKLRKIEIPSDWAKEAWNAASEQGIFQNNDPRKNITKEELAVILHRLDFIKIKKS